MHYTFYSLYFRIGIIQVNPAYVTSTVCEYSAFKRPNEWKLYVQCVHFGGINGRIFEESKCRKKQANEREKKKNIIDVPKIIESTM